jgi:hypothetical protein
MLQSYILHLILLHQLVATNSNLIDNLAPFRTNQKIRSDSFYKNYDWSDSHHFCIAGPANQGTCGSCWTWATARAYAERLCQQSFYGVRVFPSPYVTENCFTKKGASRTVCSGGNSEIFLEGMVTKGSIPMPLYPGPPEYYNLPIEKQTKIPQNCQWSKNKNERKIVTTEPWMKVVEDGKVIYHAPDKGKNRAEFIKGMQDELSKHGPAVLSLEMSNRPDCCSRGCSDSEEQELCGRHAVVLHGWTTNPKTKQFSWIAKNAWGTSRLPKFLQESEVDNQGRTLYHDNANGITTNTFPGGAMIAFSYTSVVPDVEHYLKTVLLKTKVVSKPVVSLSLFAEFDDPEERAKVKKLLPNCERLSSSTKPPATTMGRLKAVFGGGGHDDDHSNEQVDEEFKVTR